MDVTAPTGLRFGPSSRSVQALMMGVAAQNHWAELFSAFAQRLDVMKRHQTNALAS
jgi:hypothetical protein